MCIYALHFACLTGMGVRESLRGSFRLVRRHPLTTAAAIALYTLAVALGIAAARMICGTDEFSARLSFVTRPLAWCIHSQDKLLHIWTVNTEGAIEKMLDLSADDLITDNIVPARELVAEQRSGDLIRSYVARITGRNDAELTS